MGKLAVRALRAVLTVVLAGTVVIQAGMVWTLVTGNDPEDGSLPLTAFRVVTILGMITVQVALVCVWQLVAMVRRGTVFSPDSFRYVDIDVMLARRKMSVGELADRVGITPANLAVLKNGRAKAVRFATLAALCEVLKCQPGDLLRWEAEDAAGG